MKSVQLSQLDESTLTLTIVATKMPACILSEPVPSKSNSVSTCKPCCATQDAANLLSLLAASKRPPSAQFQQSALEALFGAAKPRSHKACVFALRACAELELKLSLAQMKVAVKQAIDGTQVIAQRT